MNAFAKRIQREHATIDAMIRMYCRAHHDDAGAPCAECRALAGYAHARIARCPFAADKPACQKCPVHCYKPAMRERIREVMRFAGPRMIWRHPVMAFWHIVDSMASHDMTGK